MKKTPFTFTSESVSEGHPDKVADQISDAILDLYLTQDPFSKVAVETMITHKNVIVAGEIKSKAELMGEISETVKSVKSKKFCKIIQKATVSLPAAFIFIAG